MVIAPQQCCGVPLASLRYFNVFGSRQDSRSQYAAAVPIFVCKALKNDPIPIFGDGEQTRDFIYVKDVVAANVHLADQPDQSTEKRFGFLFRSVHQPKKAFLFGERFFV